MDELRLRLRANHYRLTFPPAVDLLRAPLPDLAVTEPEWLPIVRTLAGLPDVKWTEQAELRGDLAVLRRFLTESDDWLVELRLPGRVPGPGQWPSALVLLARTELIRLLSGLLTAEAPAVWVRSWPSAGVAAFDTGRLDPHYDGAEGYRVGLFRGNR